LSRRQHGGRRHEDSGDQFEIHKLFCIVGLLLRV
jgi:hypothetical protein